MPNHSSNYFIALDDAELTGGPLDELLEQRGWADAVSTGDDNWADFRADERNGLPVLSGTHRVAGRVSVVPTAGGKLEVRVERGADGEPGVAVVETVKGAVDFLRKHLGLIV